MRLYIFNLSVKLDRYDSLLLVFYTESVDHNALFNYSKLIRSLCLPQVTLKLVTLRYSKSVFKTIISQFLCDHPDVGPAFYLCSFEFPWDTVDVLIYFSSFYKNFLIPIGTLFVFSPPNTNNVCTFRLLTTVLYNKNVNLTNSYYSLSKIECSKPFPKWEFKIESNILLHFKIAV